MKVKIEVDLEYGYFDHKTQKLVLVPASYVQNTGTIVQHINGYPEWRIFWDKKYRNVREHVSIAGYDNRFVLGGSKAAWLKAQQILKNKALITGIFNTISGNVQATPGRTNNSPASTTKTGTGYASTNSKYAQVLNFSMVLSPSPTKKPKTNTKSTVGAARAKTTVNTMSPEKRMDIQVSTFRAIFYTLGFADDFADYLISEFISMFGIDVWYNTIDRKCANYNYKKVIIPAAHVASIRQQAIPLLAAFKLIQKSKGQ